MSRSLQDIQREYQQKAIQLGAEAYKLHVLEAAVRDAEQAMNILNDKMDGLNKEANKLQAEGTPTQVDDSKFPPPAPPADVPVEEAPSEQP